MPMSALLEVILFQEHAVGKLVEKMNLYIKQSMGVLLQRRNSEKEAYV